MTYFLKSKIELKLASALPFVVFVISLLLLSLFVLAVNAGPVDDAVGVALEAADRGIRFSDAAWIFLSCFILTLIAFVISVKRMTDILLRLSTRPCISEYLREQERLERLREEKKL